MPAAGKLGKLDPHPEATHPRVRLRDYLTAPGPAVPATVDWASKVPAWPVYSNDTVGDCTCAGIGHMIQALTAYTGAEATVPGSDVLKMYEKLSGYDPATGANDNGAVEQDVLSYMSRKGLDGHKVRAFAQVDHASFAEMKAALYYFGTLYLGIQCPASAQEQFAAGRPWDVVPGSPVDGGHCVVLQKWDADYMYVVTWGKLIPMTEAFWSAFGDEAWAVLTGDWLLPDGDSPSGLDLRGLMAEFHGLTTGQEPQSGETWLGRLLGKLWK